MKVILLVEDWPETRRVVKVLTEERGFTVEAVAEEIERRGFFRGEALAVLKGETESNSVYLPLLADILDLSREEVYSVMDAAMADVAVSYGYPPPPKHGRPM
jgi:CheY-like chemotaxis protein